MKSPAGPAALPALLLMLLLASAAAGAAEPAREWVFDVDLDGKPIGEHRFTVSSDGERTMVRSRATFDVKVLGFVAYRYRHEADETWRGGCLEKLRARTDDDGQALTVDAETVEGSLKVVATKASGSYPGCVMGFAYWNPSIRQQSRLLNVQTGEYTQVAFAPLPEQIVQARGVPVSGRRWRLTGPENPLELAYTAAGDWVALESTVSGGRKLRYRLR